MRYRHRRRARSMPWSRRLAKPEWGVWAALGAVVPGVFLAVPSTVVVVGEAWHWAAGAAVLFAALALNSYLDAKRRRAWARTMHGVENLLRLDWKQFERWTAECYRARGWSVQVVGGGGADGGVDLLCTRADELCLVQCKKWTGRVGSKEVRELFGLLHHHGASSADVVALKGFTRDARDFAKGKPMRLLDGQAAIDLLKRPRR